MGQPTGWSHSRRDHSPAIEGQFWCDARWCAKLTPRLLLGPDEIEVDRHPHRQIACAIRVQLVARSSGGALRHELRPESAGLRIERRLVKIGNTVEQL